MSDPVKTAEANVARHRLELTAELRCAAPSPVLVVAHIEGLILAHIQKTVANMMGRMS